jgi:FkbM family methyltransferase
MGEATIGDIKLRLLDNNNDMAWYQDPIVCEEQQSPLYRLIAESGFRYFIDAGANYGFVSILTKKASPNIKIVALEADPKLIPIIEHNFKANDITDIQTVNAVLGNTTAAETPFSINPHSTLDNRVNVNEWNKCFVPGTTIDDLVHDFSIDGPTFIKIDTQGFELFVLKGAQQFLHNNHDWVLKMEFGPFWLYSQNTSPIALLEYISKNYEFAELPSRIPFQTPTIDSLFEHSVDRQHLSSFLTYVESLNFHRKGWVDLIVRPRTNL